MPWNKGFKAIFGGGPWRGGHTILTDRSYIGEVRYRGQWRPGRHEPIIDRATWDRVQALLGGHVYHAHQMTYAGGLLACGRCGRVVTGERKAKRTRSGVRHYVYYRCSGYNAPGHRRDRVTEAELDRQVLELFARMKVQDEDVREWFRLVLASQTRDDQREAREQRAELSRLASLLVGQQDRLLNLRISDGVDEETFARKHTELRDRLAAVKLQLDVLDRSHDETAELVSRVFELSQTLAAKWVASDYAAKRRILEIVGLNYRLDGASLVVAMRKPFDMLAEGLGTVKSSGGRI